MLEITCRKWTRRVLVLSFLLLGGASLFAQNPAKPIQVGVDATEAPLRILHARLVIPASPGPLTLLYPEWIPGEHMPSGPIADLIGLKLKAGGQPLAWRRDLVDMYAFHTVVPEGADSVEAEFDYACSAPTEGFSSGASMAANLAVINWNQVVLYPAGHPVRELTYEASLRLPAGWKFGTALPVAKQADSTIQFSPTSLETLVDSPVLAGAHFRVVQLAPGETPPHEIDIAADNPGQLEMSAEQIAHYKQLVAETGALYRSRHYRDYHFLLTLSDYVSHFGLEHHESSDDRVAANTLLDAQLFRGEAGLLPHEFTHSWNGKYRRPADLATPDYHQPMKDDLLWVYEGLTQYLGAVLTGRSGLCAPEQCRENWAYFAARLDNEPGRTWRPLQDTADSAPFLYNARHEWGSWRRDVDFYDESALIWLEADTIIRKRTNEHRSMDDFCHIFHGGPSGFPTVKPYTFDDVVDTLNQVAPYDWRGFLTARLTSTAPHAPLGGLEASGWKLVYSEAPNEHQRAGERSRRIVDEMFSIGLVVNTDDGTLRDVIPGAAAAEAGLAPMMKLVEVNGRPWSAELLRDAIRATKSGASLALLVENSGEKKSYPIDYSEGAHYPHLERIPGTPDLFGEILAPHARPAQ